MLKTNLKKKHSDNYVQFGFSFIGNKNSFQCNALFAGKCLQITARNLLFQQNMKVIKNVFFLFVYVYVFSPTSKSKEFQAGF